MASYNRLILIGNLGKDPEVKSGTSGTGNEWRIANFSLAVNRTWKERGEKKEETTWVRVVCFNPWTSKFIEDYVSKGATVMVEGRLTIRSYTSNEGDERWVTECIVDRYDGNVQLLSKSTKREAQGQGSGTPDFDDPIPGWDDGGAPAGPNEQNPPAW